MNALIPEVSAPLIFNWELPRSRRVALTGFLAGSLILHALCFYIFQVVYPPTVVLLPPPARVDLIAPNSEESRSLLRWVEAEDPALASATQRPPDLKQRDLPKLQHIPSYLAEEPKLKQIPPSPVDLRAPSPQPPGPVPMAQPRPVPPAVLAPTRVRLSEELSHLGTVSLPAPKFVATRNDEPENIRFRVAVGPDGEIRYCFALNSSGDAALDEQARRLLVLAQFEQRAADAKHADQPLAWGIATVEWGNDVAHPKPPPTTTSSP